MRLALVNIYPANTIAQYLLSSYVLKAYLDKFLKMKDGLSINILNFSNTADTIKICEKIARERPDLIGYSCYIWNIERILDVIKCLKEKGRYVNILGGPEISIDRIKTLPNPEIISYYVIGEGEKVLLNLMRYIDEKDRSSKFKIPEGVVIRLNNGFEYVPNTDRISNLDEIPSIYLNGVIENWLYEGQQAFLETQRGCPFKCKYCVYHKNVPAISSYSLERVYEELDHLIVKKRILALRILDSIFTHDLSRAKKIVRYLAELKCLDGIRLPWIYWEFTYNLVDEEFLKLISVLKYREKILNINNIKPLDRPQLYREIVKDYTVINCVGVQSFCKEALSALNRMAVNLEKLKKFMDDVNGYNIVLKIDLILGLPFETFDSYFKGLETFLPFFKDTDHILNIHRLQILPGSDLEKLCDKYEIKYSPEAPHTVFSVNTFSEKEMDYASKLTALLFRIVNSPLRKNFFEAKKRSGECFFKLIESIYKLISLSERFKNIQIIKNISVDDNYWNDEVFREIPTEWLIEIFDQESDMIIQNESFIE
ncbi:MAG: B12-binding domain-containing radical SAM protein [Candidatus Scalindua sp.]